LSVLTAAQLSPFITPKILSPSETIVYFECADLDARVERLKQLGLQFESEPTNQTWLWRESRLKDPSGNRICLFYAGENRQNPPWRVKS
jgi:predicted enzyme related to lactoylglutathione lyase